MLDRALGLCQGIRPDDANELRGLAADLNATIAATVATVNAEHLDKVHLTYVDVNTGDPKMGIPDDDSDLFEPTSGTRHNLCAAKEWLNGITLPNVSRSFHPNAPGNAAMAALVEQTFPSSTGKSSAP